MRFPYLLLSAQGRGATDPPHDECARLNIILSCSKYKGNERLEVPCSVRNLVDLNSSYLYGLRFMVT